LIVIAFLLTKMCAHAGDKGEEVRLIMVPSFALTRTAVLVDLNTLDCEPLEFALPM
jgi:hypothetical protein